MTRNRNVADVQANGVSAVPPFAAGKNRIINGDFGVWQRGTSATFSGSAVTYAGADRWWNYGGATCTVSRQTADTTGATYGLRFGRNSGQTSTTTVYNGQVLESLTSKPLTGQTVTISFYAKKGADAPSTLNLLLYTGTGTDQTATQLFSGWTNGTVIFDNAFTVTTTMTRYSYTGTIASTANQISVSFKYTPSGTAGANEWFQIENVQLEAGSVATPFTTATGTIQGELAACQRYYIRFATPSGSSGTVVSGFGTASSTTNAYTPIPLPVTMRIPPTVLDYATVRLSDWSGGTASITSLSIYDSTTTFVMLNPVVASGLTQYRNYSILAQSATAGYIGISAEL